MRIFLIAASLIFLISGSGFLLSVDLLKKVSDVLNRFVFSIDNKVIKQRRLVGVILLILSIIFWYIALAK